MQLIKNERNAHAWLIENTYFTWPTNVFNSFEHEILQLCYPTPDKDVHRQAFYIWSPHRPPVQSSESKPPTCQGSFQRHRPSTLSLFTPKDRDFARQATAVVTQPSQGLSVNESETCGLNFPQNWIHMDLRYKRENTVFQNMVWVLNNSKCWENSLDIHFTFNYSQNHSSIMLQNFILLHNVSCSEKITSIVIKYLSSQFCKELQQDQMRKQH